MLDFIPPAAECGKGGQQLQLSLFHGNTHTIGLQEYCGGQTELPRVTVGAAAAAGPDT